MCPLLTSIHWWHQLFMPSIKLSDIEMGSENQIWSKPCSTSCKNLGGEFKVATCLLRQSQRFFVWFRSGDFVCHSIRTKPWPSRYSSATAARRSFVLSFFRMKSFPVAPAYGFTYELRFHPDISHQLEFLHGTHTDQCVNRVWSPLEPWFHYFYN